MNNSINDKRRVSRSKETIKQLCESRPELENIDIASIKCKRREQIYHNTMSLEISQYLFEQYEKSKN